MSQPTAERTSLAMQLPIIHISVLKQQIFNVQKILENYDITSFVFQMSRPTAERTSLAMQLPIIHIGALKILKQLTLT